MPGSILVIDQGTTSTRSMVFGPDAKPVATAQEEFPQFYVQPGWVEHDPRDLWRTALSTARIAFAKATELGFTVEAVAIANQRETVVVWDRATRQPIHPAIVWQDRRTAARCAALRAKGAEATVQAKTGLVLDPYFSATKIAWILDHVAGARARAERGELAFGTVDSFLLSQLTDGAVHATDATNASRTGLYDIHKGRWDAELLRLFKVPRALLPEIKDSAAAFGTVAAGHLGTTLPVLSLIGDQQAALIGQACVEPGQVKATFGTGAFALLNTGTTPAESPGRLLTTVAYQLGGKRTYALEGSIFAAGATVQWLRDGLSLVRSSAETSYLAAQADPGQAVFIVPAFVGLGAPIWDAEARATIIGITRGTTRREIARAALESVAFQTADLLDAMAAAATPHGLDATLRADGGMSASDWTVQSIADITGMPVDRPETVETTALGAAYLAGWQSGLYPDMPAFAAQWKRSSRFTPAIDAVARQDRKAGWHDAVARTVLKP